MESSKPLPDKYLDLIQANYNLPEFYTEAAPTQTDGPINFYDIAASGGYLSGFNDLPETPTAQFQIPGLPRGCVAIPLVEDSMYPAYRPGDVLFILPLETPAILWGEAYVVVTQDYRTVKYLRPGNSPETVLLVAENPTIPPTEISRSLILRLFKVLGWMRRTAV